MKKPSALAARFEQILENQIQASVDTNALKKAAKDSHTKAQLYIDSEHLLKNNKHARDIFNSEPWKGTESVYDSNLRMLVDTNPPPKRESGAKHLTRAKESSLDYKLQRDHPKEPSFKEMYTERLLGPSMLVNSSVDLVNSVASAKINAAINQKTGRFDSPHMTSVRGKPLDRDHLRNCTDTNYFMNQILNKQKVLPPWVENQKNIEAETALLHRDLDKLWFRWLVSSSPLSHKISPASSLESLQSLHPQVMEIPYSESLLSTSDLAYLDERLRSVNQNIRTYNLQSPSPNFHRFKLVKEREIRQAFDRVVESFPSAITEWHTVNNAPKQKVKWGEDTGLGFWEAVKSLLTIKSTNN